MVKTKPFNFQEPGNSRNAPTDVRFGLVRLNENVLKIPLRWWIFTNDESARRAKESAASREEKDLDRKTFARYGSYEKGFALVAAEAKDPHLLDDDELRQDLEKDEHPYASFVSIIPAWSATDLLCAAPKLPEGLTPPGGCGDLRYNSLSELRGKVVVIGEHVSTDLKPLFGGQRYGAELQASYIEALLERRYVKVAYWLDFPFILLFVIVSMVLQGMQLLHRISEWSAYLLQWGVLVLMILVAALALESFGYFTPHFFLSCVPFGLSLVGLLPFLLVAQHAKSNKAKERK